MGILPAKTGVAAQQAAHACVLATHELLKPLLHNVAISKDPGGDDDMAGASIQELGCCVGCHASSHLQPPGERHQGLQSGPPAEINHCTLQEAHAGLT